MGYVSRRGKRPFEYASKSSHSHIINDPSVMSFLNICNSPKTIDQVDFKKHHIVKLESVKNNPIRHIVAIDGSFSEVAVRKEFPSCKICFFQFGALIFDTADLDDLSHKPFIDPDDMNKLKNINRLKLSLPSKNIVVKNEETLVDSVRNTIFNFFINEPNQDKNKFIDTLKWFIFGEYSHGVPEWNLANCPNCGKSNIKLNKNFMHADYTFECNYPECKKKIYLTDVFRFHEVVDNELGAGGILGYLTTLIEQLFLVHLIRLILITKPSLLNEMLFIKDGPLAFFGQTANMHVPMRHLINYLFDKHNIYLAGLEKSGPFVEHADEISSKMDPETILILDNEYIYKYIIPGKADSTNPYGRTTYYGNKVIFKSEDEQIYIVTLPTRQAYLTPQKEDIKSMDLILFNLKKLKCDMYDCSLVPVALVNKLISISNHPS